MKTTKQKKSHHSYAVRSPLAFVLLSFALSACGGTKTSVSGAGPDAAVDDQMNDGNQGGDGDGDGDGGGNVAASADAGPPCMALEPPETCVVDGGALEISGSFSDDFETPWELDSCAINGEAVAAYSNEEHWVVTQNACDSVFSPGKWSRYDWTWVEDADGGSALYLCTQVYDADTEQDAIDAARADTGDPASAGCGVPANDFAWSSLTPAD